MARIVIDEELIKRIGKLANKSKEQLNALDLIMDGMEIQKRIDMAQMEAVHNTA